MPERENTGNKTKTHAPWIILNFNVHSVELYSKSKERKTILIKNITFRASKHSIQKAGAIKLPFL